jgi:hypothetical protein
MLKNNIILIPQFTTSLTTHHLLTIFLNFDSINLRVDNLNKMQYTHTLLTIIIIIVGSYAVVAAIAFI